jgi:hypothetical protein
MRNYLRVYIRGLYIVFVKGLLGATLIAVGPYYLLWLALGQEAAETLMRSGAGKWFPIFGALWFVRRVYELAELPLPSYKRPGSS